MQTKQRIIAAAIDQFNKNGVADVSIRDISGVVGISSGNFAYHFKNKEVLLVHFYEQIYDEVDLITELKDEDGFQQFQDLLMKVTGYMERYPFFYTDMVDIFRMCPSLKKAYAERYEDRKKVYADFFRHFVRRGLLTIPENSNLVNELTHSIWFILVFWPSQRKVLPTDMAEVRPRYIVKQIWRVLEPYMTDLGLFEYFGLE